MYQVVTVAPPRSSNTKIRAKHLSRRAKRTMCGREGAMMSVEHDGPHPWCRNCESVLQRHESPGRELRPVFYWCKPCDAYAETASECKHGYSGIW